MPETRGYDVRIRVMLIRGLAAETVRVYEKRVRWQRMPPSECSLRLRFLDGGLDLDVREVELRSVVRGDDGESAGWPPEVLLDCRALGAKSEEEMDGLAAKLEEAGFLVVGDQQEDQ